MPGNPMSVAAAETSAPFIRIRSVLLLMIVGGAALFFYPRAEAAWALHGSAVRTADYALCMAGPTGPTLLRDNSPGFRNLVRRKLITADASDRPFQECAKLASELTSSASVERAHRATASSFVEFGGAAADRAAGGSRVELTLDSLGVTARPLSDLAKNAWPFARDGYVKLVKPSISAHESVHPVETPKPAKGSGLPAWRAGYRSVGEVDGALTVALGKAANLSVFKSRDGGLTFKPAPVRGVESFAERCTAGDRSFAFALSSDSATLLVVSHGSGTEPHATPLAKGDVELAAAACDDRALVALLRAEGSKSTTLALCQFRGACKPITAPRFPSPASGLGPNVDVARLAGVTVVASTSHGIVRVSSSRDDGHTWLPLAVAYDDTEHPELRFDVRVPSRLLALGKRLLLYGGAPKPGQSYSVLVSDDFGASWRTP